MNVGYARVSTREQNTARHEVILREMGAEKIYVDRFSGKDAARPQLREMLGFIREGDTVFVESISRFARNARDLLELVGQLSQKGVGFVSQKESIDTHTPTGRFMLTVFDAVTELEREYLLQRQREGIAQAKALGKYKGRKPISIPMDLFRQLYQRWKAGEITAVAAQKQLGLSASTFYRRVREYERRTYNTQHDVHDVAYDVTQYDIYEVAHDE